MSKITVAFGSFALGALCVFFLGNHASTFLGPLAAQPTPRQFEANQWVPRVPPIGLALAEGNITDRGATIDIDGLNSRGDTFHDATLVYGGGAFHMEHATFSGNNQIALIGAAANTATFLNMFGMIGCPAAKPQAPTSNPKCADCANS